MTFERDDHVLTALIIPAAGSIYVDLGTAREVTPGLFALNSEVPPQRVGPFSGSIGEVKQTVIAAVESLGRRVEFKNCRAF